MTGTFEVDETDDPWGWYKLNSPAYCREKTSQERASGPEEEGT